MSDVNLSISQEVVRPIIEAKIQTAIAAELQGAASIMEQIVAQVLTCRVDSEGKPERYDRANAKTFVQWVCENAVRAAATSAVKEAVEKMRPELEKLIVKDLEKRKKELAGTMVGFFAKAVESYYKIETTVILKPNN